MYDYVTKELPAVVSSVLPVNGLQSIMGHSMGGLQIPSTVYGFGCFSHVCARYVAWLSQADCSSNKQPLPVP